MLKQGEDFYIEDEKFVLTTTFLLRRGACCHSRCKHCPYGTFGPPNVSSEYRGPPLSCPKK